MNRAGRWGVQLDKEIKSFTFLLGGGLCQGKILIKGCERKLLYLYKQDIVRDVLGSDQP